MIVEASASVPPAAPVGPPVAVPPDLAALARETLVPSQVAAVGAEVGHVTAESSAKTPELPHVYVVVAAVPPTVAA